MEYEASSHGPCGQPMADALNPDSSGWWLPHVVECQACAARDEQLAELQRTHGSQAGRYHVYVTPDPDMPPLRPWVWPHQAASEEGAGEGA